ncbi:ATP-binding cassette domain-containing protein [Hydrotalea sp.]|uniref:ATP-binding cassette domain-containing protein n=1 Tax=Hydrotalea sp. TaxID=2881279 RepID=UPI003D1206A0
MNNLPAIQVTHLNIQQYGITILQDISFTIQIGEHLFVTGMAGSGKTTLGKALATRIFFKGKIAFPAFENANQLPRIVYIEDTHQWKNLTNLSDFYYQQRYNSCDAYDSETMVQHLAHHTQQLNNSDKDTENYYELCQKFNLLHRLETPLIQLSNGEQKKLQIIKCLMHNPEILIVDNILTGLDKTAQNTLLQLLEKYATNGVTIVYIGNDKIVPNFITHVLELNVEKKSRYFSKEMYLPKSENQILPNFKKLLIANQLPTSETRVIEMQDTTVIYGDKKILENINWNVRIGEKWLIKGHNGAGKSTLLSLINGDNPQAYANAIKIFGTKRGGGESIWDIKKRIGYISPELHKYFDKQLTVEKTIASGFFDTMGVYKILNETQLQTLNTIIQEFQLQSEIHKQLKTLSFGMQRWVLLARTLIKNPPLLIFDEPCQGLDVTFTKLFLNSIQQIAAQQPTTTLLYVTHVDDEIPNCINKVLILQNGKAKIEEVENIQNKENKKTVRTTHYCVQH